MKLQSTDLPKLQSSLLIALLIIVVGIAAVYAGLKVNHAAMAERQAAQAERNEFDDKLKRVRNEENEIRLKAATFGTLQTQGIIGNEQRLEWVELIKSIRDKRRLIDLQYEIAPQRPLDAGAGDGLRYFASNMKVRIKLLHEEDLIRFIDDLRRDAQALIQIKSCNVSRLPKENAASETNARLQAECSIDWVTIHDTAGNK